MRVVEGAGEIRRCLGDYTTRAGDAGERENVMEVT